MLPKIIIKMIKAKELLEKQGYQVYNLWHIEDVTGNYNCTDDEAMEVLIAALTNESVIQQIWHAINFHAEENGLKQKQKEDV
jgi:hypothetical protein